MSDKRVRMRGVTALVGILTLLAAVALAAGTTRTTEATWADTVNGSSVFGIHPDARTNRARATSAYGSMTYQTAGQANFPKVEVLGRSEGPLTGASIGPITREVRASNLPATVDGTVCARTTSPGTACALDPVSGTSAFAQARSSNLRVARGNGFTLLRYGDGQVSTAATATAACWPGQLGVAGLTAGGPVVLGNSNNTFTVPIPASNTDTVTRGTAGTTTFTVRIQRVEKVATNYARSELRLRVSADGSSDDPWVLHIILASAECGLALPIEENLPQPTATNFPALTTGLMSLRAAAAPAAVQVTDEPVDESVNQAGADQADPDTDAMESAARSEQDDSAISPRQPESVLLGRWFTVTSRDGVELGSAKIEDIVRTPGCGVELTLSITTSAEAGPDRWASIGPGDVAELRSSGATRDARTVSSDCEQSAASTTTRLSPDRGYEIVLAFQLDDSAQRAMLRPEGTAGWVFDLPSLTKVAVPTNSSPVPSIASTPATSAPATVTVTATSEA